MIRTIPIEQLDTTITDHYDIFICCNSFESRSTTIATHIDLSKFKDFMVFCNNPCREEAIVNLNIFENIFTKDKYKLVNLPFKDPVESADCIREALANMNNCCAPSIFIDITTFTHEILLILLAIVKDMFPQSIVTCGYVNAKEYSCDFDNQENKWLSKGVGEIRSVLGYSGVIRPSQETLLMVIVGYEYERAVNIIEAIEPDFLSLGYAEASDSITEKNKGANEHYALLVKQMSTYYDDICDFTITCNDPFVASQSILEQINTIGKDKNIIIVPMNNKISTIGVALVCSARPDVQLCYAPALVYNYNSYSSPGDKCYLFDMPIQKHSNEH